MHRLSTAAIMARPRFLRPADGPTRRASSASHFHPRHGEAGPLRKRFTENDWPGYNPQLPFDAVPPRRRLSNLCAFLRAAIHPLALE